MTNEPVGLEGNQGKPIPSGGSDQPSPNKAIPFDSGHRGAIPWPSEDLKYLRDLCASSLAHWGENQKTRE